MKKIEYGTEYLDHLKDSVHDLFDDNKELRKEIERLNNIIKDEKDIRLKAIEYIEKNCTEQGEGKWAYRTINADNTLNILKGVDKE